MKIIKSNVFYEASNAGGGKELIKNLTGEKGVYYNDASQLFLMTDKKWDNVKDKYNIGRFEHHHGYSDVEDYVKDVHKGEYIHFLGLDYPVSEYSNSIKEYFKKHVDDKKERIPFAEKGDWVGHIDDVLHNSIMKEVKKEFEKQMEGTDREGFKMENLRRAFKSIARRSS